MAQPRDAHAELGFLQGLGVTITRILDARMIIIEIEGRRPAQTGDTIRIGVAGQPAYLVVAVLPVPGWENVIRLLAVSV